MKEFKHAVTRSGERCDVVHVDVGDFSDVPDDLVEKVHAVCIHEGRMLIVNHPQWNIWGIPGGSREPGEPITETLSREILEETNCKMRRAYPVSYQKIISPDGSFHFWLHYLCYVEPIGEFVRDPAGNIARVQWIAPADYESYIEAKPFKRAVVARALAVLGEVGEYDRI